MKTHQSDSNKESNQNLKETQSNTKNKQENGHGVQNNQKLKINSQQQQEKSKSPQNNEIDLKRQDIQSAEKSNQGQTAVKIKKKDDQQQQFNKQQLKQQIPNIKFSPDIKRILDQIDNLSLKEKREATIISQDIIEFYIKRDIDCVGCGIHLNKFLNDLLGYSKQKNKQINLDGIVIYPNNKIGIKENYLENNFNIASVLQYHMNNAGILQELNKCLGLKKNRCLLHSKKPVPDMLWKDTLQNLMENNLQEMAEISEIDESQFLMNLQGYLKKRKFCTTCKENILTAYQSLKEKAEENFINDSIDNENDIEPENLAKNMLLKDKQNIIPFSIQSNHKTNTTKLSTQTCHQSNTNQQISINKSEQQQQLQKTEKLIIKGTDQQQESSQMVDAQFQQQKNHHDKGQGCEGECDDEDQMLNQNLGLIINNKKSSDKIQLNQEWHDNNLNNNEEDEDEDYEEEDEEEDDEDQDVDEGDSQDGFSQNCDLISFIKFCKKTQKIILPLEFEIIVEILSRTDVDTSLKDKHSQTSEAAQEELLICLGITLKDRLQTFWKSKKADEISKSLFLNMCAQIFVNTITCEIQKKMEISGQKTQLEEYLNVQKQIQDAKKEKQKKKRQKRKEKKKLVQNNNQEDPSKNTEAQVNNNEGQDDDLQDSEDENQKEEEEKQQKQETKNNQLSFNPGKNFKNVQSGNIQSQQQPPFKVKHSKSQEKEQKENQSNNKNGKQHIDDQSNQNEFTDQSQSSNLKKTQTTSNSSHNNLNKKIRSQNTLYDEKEKKLLEDMGWKEEDMCSDDSHIEIEENEVNKFKNQWKQIEENRQNQRKKLEEQFKNLMRHKSK